MERYVEFEDLNPLRAPDWRWQRIESLANRVPSPGRCSSRDDAWVRLGRNFLCRWPRASEEEREQIKWECPELAYAYLIYEQRTTNPSTSLCVEARLLAGQNNKHIANELATTPDTIDCYEALFFHVADRLEQRDWITNAVLLPPIVNHLAGLAATRQAALGEMETAAARHSRNHSGIGVALPFHDASVRYLAYFGGPILVDFLLHGIQPGRPLTSQDDLARWLDTNCAMTVRRRSLQAAAQVEIDQGSVMKLLDVHARIMKIATIANSEESGHTTIERHIKALLDDIPWRVGPRPSVEDPRLDQYDGAPGEPRDEEVLSGAPLPAEELRRPLPKPRSQQGQPPPSDQQSDFV
jgi:hypothetical protein